MSNFIEKLSEEKKIVNVLLHMANATLIKEDKNKLNKKEYAEILNKQNIKLINLINEIKNKYKSKEIIDLFKQNSFFKEWSNKKYNILKIAIEAFWKNDYLIFNSLICPVIEGFVLKAIRLSGGKIYNQNFYKGGFIEVTLGVNLIPKKFNFLSENYSSIFCFHLNFILKNEGGLDLRNLWAHAWLIDFFHQKEPANWFFQILCLFLSDKFYESNIKKKYAQT